jgi:pimeloyl-ACP methyl ester carboxylesterase
VLADLDAVALDLPGHGVAPEPPEAWSTREYAEWVEPVLDDIGSGPIVVVGHSFGARVAVHLASALDDKAGSRGRIRALVLTGAPMAPAPGQARARPPIAYRAGRALHRAGLVSDGRMERLRQDHGSDDYRHASPVMRGVLVKAVGETERSAYVPPLQDWASAGRPVELVWWEHDTQASLAGMLPAVEGLTSVRVTVVPGAGHLVNRQLASELRSALVRHRPTPLSSDPV